MIKSTLISELYDPLFPGNGQRGSIHTNMQMLIIIYPMAA
jgi:hypothetical protein